MSQNIGTDDISDESEYPVDDFVIDSGGCGIGLDNADILSNLESKVSRVGLSQWDNMIALLFFGDMPGKSHMTCHNIDVGLTRHIKQQPYRLSPHKLNLVHE